MGSSNCGLPLLGRRSGGAFCIAALGELKKKYLPLSKWAALVSAPAIIIGLIFLLADTGGRTKAINVCTNVGSSVMTWGSIIIALFTVVGLLYLILLARNQNLENQTLSLEK